MTEGEKKAIEKLKDYKELFSKGYCKDCNELCVIDNFPSKDLENNINIILNLIEKLQKEKIPTKFYACDPNKYKECKKKHCYINGGECDATIDETKVKYINLENYIPKEKIREKIQKLENGEQCYYEFSTGDLVDLLKELLEEG